MKDVRCNDLKTEYNDEIKNIKKLRNKDTGELIVETELNQLLYKISQVFFKNEASIDFLGWKHKDVVQRITDEKYEYINKPKCPDKYASDDTIKKIIMGKPRGNRLDYFTAVLLIAMVAKNKEEFVRYMAMSGNELFKKEKNKITDIQMLSSFIACKDINDFDDRMSAFTDKIDWFIDIGELDVHSLDRKVREKKKKT
jgi:hypothetical protein